LDGHRESPGRFDVAALRAAPSSSLASPLINAMAFISAPSFLEAGLWTTSTQGCTKPLTSLAVSGTKHSLGDSFKGNGLRSWNFNQHCTPPRNRVVTRGS
jgi:hypothetical protein